jgi:hypothetical protein
MPGGDVVAISAAIAAALTWSATAAASGSPPNG